MGYSGLGMQRWISTSKPREFLGKRSKPDGGGVSNSRRSNVSDYFQYKPKHLTTTRKRIYTKAYKKKLNSELQTENRKENILAFIGVTFVSILITAIIVYLNAEFHLF